MFLSPENRFHFAFLVSDEGDYPTYPDFLNSGPAHAEAYWHLISSEKPEGWDYRFVGCSAFLYVVLRSSTGSP